MKASKDKILLEERASVLPEITILPVTVVNTNNTGPVSRDPDDELNTEQGVILPKMDGI
jgi:hypothetical protein